MISVLIWFALFCCSYSVALYVYDYPDFPQNLDYSPRKASVYDLPDNASRYTIEKYIKDQILPSEYYFSLRNEYETANESSNFAEKLFLIIVPSLLLLKQIIVLLKQFGILMLIVGCISTVAFLFIIGWIIRKIYTSNFSIPRFPTNTISLRKALNNLDDEYEVGLDIAKSNYVTKVLYCYFDQIHETMQKRISLASVVSWICGIVYFLFFFRIPNS